MQTGSTILTSVSALPSCIRPGRSGQRSTRRRPNNRMQLTRRGWSRMERGEGSRPSLGRARLAADPCVGPTKWALHARTRMKTVVALAVLVAGSIGCGRSDPQSPCPPSPGVGLVVTVANDRTGDPICDAVVTVAPPSGGTSRRLEVTPSCTYTGAWNTALVRAERTGFSPASQVVPVRSTGGECPMAEATYVTIRLAPVG